MTASGYSYFKTRLGSNAPDGNGLIYFKTAAENYYSEDKKVPFTVYNCHICGNAAFNSYSVYMGGNAKWNSIITEIRIDPAQ